MKELLQGESTISLEAAVLKCPNAELYLLPLDTASLTVWNISIHTTHFADCCAFDTVF
jgi:hypothetical protein